MNARHFAAALLLASATPTFAADDPVVPPTVADLTGPRSASIGAGRALAGGNEAMFLNPGALAARRRYAVETSWMLERNGGTNAGQFLTGSVVDSETGSVAGGFAYTRVVSGPSVGNAYHLSLAFPVASRVFAGVTGKYLSLDGAEKVSAGTVDAGLYLELGSLLSAGFAGYNLVDVNHVVQAPRGVGAGVAIGDDRRFHLAADWRGDFQRRRDEVTGAEKMTSSFGGGGEILLGGNFPVRGGYQHDGTRDVDWWSAGAGFVTAAGLAVDVAYRQSVDDPADRQILAGLKLIILTQ